MKNFTTILSVSLLISSSLVTEVFATRSSPKPWLARSSAPKSEMRASTPRRTVRKARPARGARVKRVHRVQRQQPKPILVEENRPSAKGEQIVEQAKRYHGTRYRFGGDSKTKGFDCSGLIRRIYNDLNLKKLPHTSSGLYEMGNPVRLNELRPGDLVFFKNTYKRGISHVGVYAGRNRFIHAQNRRQGVTMTQLSDPYYQLHYAGARRLY